MGSRSGVGPREPSRRKILFSLEAVELRLFSFFWLRYTQCTVSVSPEGKTSSRAGINLNKQTRPKRGVDGSCGGGGDATSGRTHGHERHSARHTRE